MTRVSDQRLRQSPLLVVLLSTLCIAAVSKAAVTLKPHTRNWVPKIKIRSGPDRVYGVTFEYRSTDEAIIAPRDLRLYKGKSVTTQQTFYAEYGLLSFHGGRTWRKGRFEFLSKKGTTGVTFSFRLLRGKKGQVRNVRLVPGGFPKSPPVPGAPYVRWIRSLRARPDLARHSPLVTLAKEGSSIWWGGSRRLAPTSSDRHRISRESAPYLKVSPERLIELMPERRPFGYYVSDYQRRRGKVKRPLWNPLEPDVCYNRDGSVCDYKREYPLTGTETVIAPSGKAMKFPYHQPPGTSGKRKGREPNARVYWDKFMSTARVSEMTRNAYFLAIRYRTDGDKEAGLRAAAMLWALSRRIPHYPIYGSATSRWPWYRFWPPDTYELSRVFIVGTWHTPSMRFFTTPVRTFDLLRDSPDLWRDLDRITKRPSRQDVADGLLAAARISLMLDASRRVSPLHYYHNVANSQSLTLIEMGMAIGCPELVHYGLRKTQAILRATFMADGMFPESTSYMAQVLGQYGGVFGTMEGYSDPPGYTAKLDGVRFDTFQAAEDGAQYTFARALYDRLRFPDGVPLTVHDTWPHTTHVRTKRPPKLWTPLVIPDFGHVGLGWGSGDRAVASHLHFSGFYNHGHLDLLNFTLWAYGDELTADLGYTHVGLYARGSISHNIVVVDGQPQKRGHAGSMLSLHTHAKAAQAVLAEGPHAYDAVSRYRRGIVLVPFSPKRDVVVDVFEVRGGDRHEWMTNGCADYEQDLATTLKPTRQLDHLARDGKALTVIGRSLPVAVPGKPSPFWGAFRNARLAEFREPWRVTLTPGQPVPRGTPGAGPRAWETGPKPGLRLHWLAPMDATAILCRAPRCRYHDELADTTKARAAFGTTMLHKVVVRREGKALDSTFVAVWEPFTRKPWLDTAEQLDGIPPADGVGVRLKDGSQSAVVLYRRPESTSPLKAGGVESDARFTVFRGGFGEQALDVYDGTRASAGPVAVELKATEPLRVAAVSEDKGVYAIDVRGDLSAYPKDARAQPHAGAFVVWRQEGQANRWLPLERVEPGKAGRWRLVLTRAPGFTYHPRRRVLDETHFPMRRGLRGAARIELPVWATVRWRVTDGRVTGLRVRAGCAVTVRLAGLGGAKSFRVRGADGKAHDLPVTLAGQAGLIHLDPATLGKGWWRAVD